MKKLRLQTIIKKYLNNHKGKNSKKIVNSENIFFQHVAATRLVPRLFNVIAQLECATANKMWWEKSATCAPHVRLT